MASNFNVENTQNLCRICLKSGDVNIWTCKFLLQRDSDIHEHIVDDTLEKSFVEMISIFFNSQDLLNFSEEFPMLCQQCLEDLKFCYSVYEKVKLANAQLINLYQESLNQCVEEEHLIETIESIEDCKDGVNSIEIMEKENMMQYDIDNIIELTPNKQSPPKHITLDKNDSFIVTQFVPELIASSESTITNDHKNNAVEFRPQNLLTVNLKAVEVQNFENIDRIQPNQIFPIDTTEPAIYVCQYCPQAFTKSEYLKTHIQKSHVCKFCTQPFILTDDLFSHIREVHTENKCAICQKHFSSGTNLRHHIKRVHRINLPAKVTLIDFIKSSTQEESNQGTDMEFLDEMGTADLDFDTEYLWKSEDCVIMLNESNSEIN